MRATFVGVFLALAVFPATPVPLFAHHSVAAFDTTKEITIKGIVTEWLWANPHCILKFDAKDEAGVVKNWAVEAQNPIGMTERGWSKTSFKAGDEVTLTLKPARNGDPVGLLMTASLPNGTKLVVRLPSAPTPQ